VKQQGCFCLFVFPRVSLLLLIGEFRILFLSETAEIEAEKPHTLAQNVHILEYAKMRHRQTF
jgi:hypothetical protein